MCRSSREKIYPVCMFKKKYWNSPVRWRKSWSKIAGEAYQKQEQYQKIYDDLKSRLSGMGDCYFNGAVLLAYRETLLKMQKNKCKYQVCTVLCNWLSVILNVGTVIAFLAISLLNIYENFGAIFQWDKDLGIMEQIFSINTCWGLLKMLIIVLVVFVAAFVVHRFVAWGIQAFKPKETWIRHSKHFFKLNIEIINYLDKKGIYDSGDNNNNYLLFREQIFKIWEENQETFWKNMSGKEAVEPLNLENAIKSLINKK